jgi:biopolymer transport protein ExbD
MGLHPDSDGGMMCEINVTPLVDVMLVLLVVFILCAPLLAPQSLKVQLPHTVAVSAGQDHGALLSVDAAGHLALDGRTLDEAALAYALQRHAANPGFQLRIAADQSVPYGRVAAVMSIAQHAQVFHLSFVTLARPGRQARGA